jgi:hypothetical protein
MQAVDVDPGSGFSGFVTDGVIDIRQFLIRQVNVIKVNEADLYLVHLPGAHKNEGVGALSFDRYPVF